MKPYKLLLLLTAFGPVVSNATTLDFENLGIVEYDPILPTLGSNANAAGNGYSEGSGWTPNVAVSMMTTNSSGGMIDPHIAWWSDGFGDLHNVGFHTTDGGFARITLTANPGFLVTLNSFDLGGYSVDRTASRLRIMDENGTDLWNQSGATILNATHSSFTPSVTSSKLVLEYGTNWNIGIDNVNFTQMSAPVPEPVSMLILSTGLLGLAHRRRK